MRAIAIASAQANPQIRTVVAPQTFLVWLIPIIYPLSLSATFRSAELTRTNVLLGSGLLALSIAWSVAAPVVGWLALNYLDRGALERNRNRLMVHAALLAAVSPALFTAMRRISSNQLMAWYLVIAAIALAAFLPNSDSSSPASATKFRHIHASSAIVLAAFALAHVFNHAMAIVSLERHPACAEIGLPAEYRAADPHCGGRGAGVHLARDGLEALPAARHATAEPATAFGLISRGVSGYAPDHSIHDTAERNRHGLRVGFSRPCRTARWVINRAAVAALFFSSAGCFRPSGLPGALEPEPGDFRIRSSQDVVQRHGLRWGDYSGYQPGRLWRAFNEVG